MEISKSSEIEAFMRSPSDRIGLVLVCGPDDGLVTERSTALVKWATGGGDDPFSLVRLDGQDLLSDPARLVDEARTVSLFGSRRVVWVREIGGRAVLPAVEPLLAEPAVGSLVVLEAGDLKKTAPLRRKIADHPNAAVLVCYADDARDIARLVDRELAEAGLSIDRDAREVLEANLGGDRLASRGELRKLCLYAHGEKRVTLADVEAIVGDASGLAMDEYVDAVAGGDPTTADRLLARLGSAGGSASSIVSALIRHFQMLERLRAEMSAGRKAIEAVAQAQPPLFYRRRERVTRQLGLWNPERLRRAAALLDEALLRSRTTAALEDAVASDLTLTLARVARAADRR